MGTVKAYTIFEVLTATLVGSILILVVFNFMSYVHGMYSAIDGTMQRETQTSMGILQQSLQSKLYPVEDSDQYILYSDDTLRATYRKSYQKMIPPP